MATLLDDNTISQNRAILKYLQEGNTITDNEARELFGAGRLSARIGNLKEKGYVIEMKLIQVIKSNGKKANIGQYKLIEAA